MVKIHTMKLENRIYPLGFKVVTENLESLGLRKNPNIIRYPINEWCFLNPENIRKGNDDFGGIWLARTLSGARGLSRYMKNKHSKKTRIFESVLDEILYANDYRIKTNGIYLVGEIKS